MKRYIKTHIFRGMAYAVLLTTIIMFFQGVGDLVPESKITFSDALVASMWALLMFIWGVIAGMERSNDGY